MKYLIQILIFFVVGCGTIHTYYRGPVGGLGPRGTPGSSCFVEQDASGATITCQDGSSAFVPNGLNGADGNDGQDGVDGEDGQDGLDGQDAELVFVDPCPSLVIAYPELLLLANGKFYAVYASGTKIHLAYIGVGSYNTTDGRACNFTIISDGVLQ